MTFVKIPFLFAMMSLIKKTTYVFDDVQFIVVHIAKGHFEYGKAGETAGHTVSRIKELQDTILLMKFPCPSHSIWSIAQRVLLPAFT